MTVFFSYFCCCPRPFQTPSYPSGERKHSERHSALSKRASLMPTELTRQNLFNRFVEFFSLELLSELGEGGEKKKGEIFQTFGSVW